MNWLKKSLKMVLGLLVAVTMVGCASTGSSSSGSNSEVENKISSNKQHLTLEDYLRRLGGVKVSGSGSGLVVSIRSQMSIKDPQEQPLFVLNGREIGTDFAKVNEMVAPGTIKSVEAIPASRATGYGMRGGAGVIVIETE